MAASGMPLGQTVTFTEQLAAERSFGIGGLVEAAVLQLGHDDVDEVLVALGHDDAAEVEAIHLAILDPGLEFVGNR